MKRHPLFPALRPALACGALLTVSLSAPAVECGMTQAFRQPDTSAKGGATPVWADTGNGALLFVKALNVNTDGTRRSYSVDDFWGEKTALNNLCNAMSDGCAGLSREARAQRKAATQQAAAAGWPAEQLKKTRISPAIIPFKDGKPCPAVDGFLVSATALHAPKISDACKLNNYVDALVTPALVLPGNRSSKQQSEFVKHNAKVGDLVVAMAPGGAAPVYAVVGDTGPANKLGEGSIALNGKLLGKSAEPANYDEVLGRGKQNAGKGWVVPKAIVMIFPGTRDSAHPFMTPDRIEPPAKKRFEEWGGVARLKACAAAYEK